MAKTLAPIRFNARVSRPGGSDKGADWLFLNLPQEASDQLPTRSMVSVEGTCNDAPFVATLEPDGQGGHWLKLTPKLQELVGATAGEIAEFEIAPATVEPEPEVPDDFWQALEQAPPKAMATWLGTTAVARRDWIAWVTSGKKAETRVKRIEVACSKLAAGNKRACCFDRSGMYSKSLTCPVAHEE
ncbi:MAG TPA: YdeI/OmpD-associated family protein [Fimbriimonas sp.]|nr:YdeI/OmpD-associated family protein [Fimbriimonas sp.]